MGDSGHLFSAVLYVVKRTIWNEKKNPRPWPLAVKTLNQWPPLIRSELNARPYQPAVTNGTREIQLVSIAPEENTPVSAYKKEEKFNILISNCF
jgi:hypothetical protein